ncbi:hypothetical protein DSCW_07620 [Desulfosarcina widdelii]|uniref:Uncharacterized protein n=1 Tax=Desulfosarcina widdelii TaxID=947919 RepID=A0A5K7YY54_9BACT|nr:hypothetical protein [Desulfosarcina widdelii]BBO73345.1 hypothetical protein DSCW_07620 [Desulfosarcina widdelii]
MGAKAGNDGNAIGWAFQKESNSEKQSYHEKLLMPVLDPVAAVAGQLAREKDVDGITMLAECLTAIIEKANMMFKR